MTKIIHSDKRADNVDEMLCKQIIDRLKLEYEQKADQLKREHQQRTRLAKRLEGRNNRVEAIFDE
jgi:hypothetical protein